MSEAYHRAAAQMLRGRTDRNIVVGPPLWHPEGGAYFIVALSKGGFAFDQVKVGKGVDICESRDGLLAALRAHPAAVIIHDVDDEMRMVQTCEALWPCAGLVAIRRQIEAQRAVLKHPLRMHH